MAGLDELLSAPDAFALFGLERSFDVNLEQLQHSHDTLVVLATTLGRGEPEKSAQLSAKIREARDVLANPVARGRLLLDLLGGAGDPANTGPPAKFREKRDAAARDGSWAWADGERRRLVATASYLFRQLGSADNGVVQRERRRRIGESLHAIEAIDRGRAAATAR